MSRVFEALTRAGDEKQQQGGSPVEKFEKTLCPTGLVEGRRVFSDQYMKLSGPVGGTTGDSPELSPKIANSYKSWRETFEEWIFGWDLGRYSNYPIVALERESPASEQYKILREQVKRLRIESGIRTLSITSPVKRDGKTTVAVNLAAALSLDYEENVLLVDGDLRAPSVHRYFNASQSPGLTDYLSSNCKIHLKSLVQDTFLPGLRILSSGRPSHFASELLAKERMTRVIEEAQAEFAGHHIIIDSPPILSTPDPLVIARHVDGVLLVMRAGKTPRDYLTKALQSLNSHQVMGVVLNGTDLGISSKYYYYSTNGAQ
jgi:capsular exopolysaccharide synthesis family protein